MMGNAFAIILGLATIGSLILAVYYQRENRRLHRTRYRYSWADVQQGVSALIPKIRKDFTPNVIVTVTGSGALIANLFMKLSNKRLPIYHVMIEEKDDRWGYSPKDHVEKEAGRWIIHIPQSVLGEDRERNILILDSSFLTGATIRVVKSFLQDNGFQSIRFACLVEVKPPDEAPFIPDLHYYENPIHEFYYPWGKG